MEFTEQNIQSINSSGKPLPTSFSKNRLQSPSVINFRGGSPNKRNSQNYSQNRYIRTNSQKSCSEMIVSDQTPIEATTLTIIEIGHAQILEICSILMIDQEILHRTAI